MERGSPAANHRLAHYSDGSTEDVTRMAQFEPNDTEMAEVDHDRTGEDARPGRARRHHGPLSGAGRHVSRDVPLGAAVATLPPERNLIDERVFSKLKVLGIPPSPLCDDATFLRRVSIDIAGRLPTEREVTAFLADRDPAKRDKLIDRLLDSPAYADYFANKWNLILRNKKRTPDRHRGDVRVPRWIRNSLYENKPFDQFVREILTASGDPASSPAVVWYREVDEINEQVEDTAQLFLGLRIQCARCHHHPFEKWSQDDYYGFSAFFSAWDASRCRTRRHQRIRERRLFHNEGIAEATNPETGKSLRPTALGGAAALDPGRPRPARAAGRLDGRPEKSVLRPARWSTATGSISSAAASSSPKTTCGRPIRPRTPNCSTRWPRTSSRAASILKDLVRTICRSSTYQFSSFPTTYNMKDKQNFSRYYPQRLEAEVLYDAFHQVTATSQPYAGLPAGTHAVQLPDPGVGPYFLTVFGQPQGDTACECERSQDANLAQSLHLLNSSEVQGKIASPSGRAALWPPTSGRSRSAIRELYRWVYSREPNADELHIAEGHLAKHRRTRSRPTKTSCGR